MKRKSRGFTLVEFIVVMAIIAILVLLALPRFMDYVDKARVTNIKNDIKIAEDLLTEYLIEYDTLPEDWEEVSVLELETLKEESKLYEKEGLVSEIQDGDYVTIDKQFLRDSMKTRLRGTFYTNLEAKVYYEDLKPGKVKSLEERIEEGLDDIEDKIDKIEDKIDELPEDIDPEDTPEDIQDKIDEIIDDINEVKDDIDDVEDLIEELPENNRQDYQDRLDELKDRLEDLEDSFTFNESMVDVFVAHGWIPVATAEELQQINDDSEEPQTFGAGTDWEGQYVGNLGSEFIQVQDIDLSGYSNWVPIGIDTEVPFEGDYNGGMYSIGNLNIVEDSDRKYVGLFGVIEGDVSFKNMQLDNMEVAGSRNAGGLIGLIKDGDTVINNLRCIGNVQGQWHAGGIIGCGDSTGLMEIKNVAVSGDISSNDELGGIIGKASAKEVIIESVRYEGGVEGGVSSTGGIIGGWYNNEGSIEIKDVSIGGNMSLGSNSGGVIGQASGEDVIIEGVVYRGNIEGGSSNIGGIIGLSECGGQLEIRDISINSDISCVITSSGNLGGVIGHLCGGSNIIEGAIYEGNIEGGEGLVGGIIGSEGSSGTVQIRNVTVKGDMSSSKHLGGIIGGSWGEDVTIERVNYEGNIEGGSDPAGGVIGFCGNSNSRIIVRETNIKGDFESDQYLGGMMGCMHVESVTVEDSSYMGQLSGGTVGGVIGYINEDSEIVISGTITGGDYTSSEGSCNVGGFMGMAVADCLVVEDSKYTGRLSGNGKVGGIIGFSRVSGGLDIRETEVNGDIVGSTIGGILGQTELGVIELENVIYSGNMSNKDEGSGINIGGLVGLVQGECELNINGAIIDGGIMSTKILDTGSNDAFGGVIGGSYAYKTVIIEDVGISLDITAKKNIGKIVGAIPNVFLEDLHIGEYSFEGIVIENGVDITETCPEVGNPLN